jgi:hypothetical protein
MRDGAGFSVNKERHITVYALSGCDFTPSRVAPQIFICPGKLLPGHFCFSGKSKIGRHGISDSRRTENKMKGSTDHGKRKNPLQNLS